MKLARIALLSTAALSLGACATTGTMSEPQEVAVVTQADEQQAAHDALFALFADADERNLKLNPIGALFRGDMRYADRLGDYLTDEFTAASKADTETNLTLLAAIDRSKLSPTDQIAYDVFAHDQKGAMESFAPELMAASEVRPVNHFSGFHTFYPSFASGQSAAPFKTVTDYENNLKRHADYIAITDRAIGKFREGMKTGVFETKLTIGNVVSQLDTQLAMPIEDSPFWMPIKNMPEDFSAEDKARLTAEYRTTTQAIYAAHTRLRDFLRDEYLPVARDSVGLGQMKGGPAYYRFLIENSTTLPLEPEYLHQLGLSEVARIKGGMEQIKDEVGFKGTLNEFFDYVRTDEKFKPKSREALTQSYYDIGKRVDEQIGNYFSLLPKTPLQIKPYEEWREKFEAGGSYDSGSPDGTRPGTFYFNAYDLPSRLTTGNVTLYLHEGAPGHHFQISLAQENEALPAFMRFGGNTAYVEGWALYAETLGYEMGFYKDPWARYGTLQDEQLRAMRLVVDTGIHAKGWTREQAIDFMLANSGMTRTEVVAEVERYIAIPSQALAYKVGALMIQELRKRAEEKLGDKFDIRAFHAQVLDTGALPLPVLEEKIDRWIAGGGK
ncbi:DUF885 domain-containing protein [Qipengyuania soli]|uniref:DUF885 domain-containing protein n=1 Tax=Qipengyuania soli TaxID=2782568 RepID=A0A7S8F4Y8_9SPHN|nr:DUF885 domain-containing protein [Qipengyuania soli]QPC99203.1 DUF885 domain-containing protein [Qipengyuania soli]